MIKYNIEIIDGHGYHTKEIVSDSFYVQNSAYYFYNIIKINPDSGYPKTENKSVFISPVERTVITNIEEIN